MLYVSGLFQTTLNDMVRPFDEHEKEYPMKLYIYDHCPFCVRARMAAGLFGADVEEVVLANDDEATPIGMIGAKQVPILQKEDGSFMGESLDVVRYLDREGRLKDETRPEIQAWLDKVGEYNLKLVQPRVIKLELPEFETPEAVKYFTDKKEKSIGSFAANLEKTGQYVQRLNGDLAELETLMTEGGAGLNGEIGMEDILVFPILRNLTVVRGVEWPQKIMDYLLRMSEHRVCRCISTAPCNNRIRRIKQTERSSENSFQTTFPFAPALPSGSEWNQAEQAWREIVDV